MAGYSGRRLNPRPQCQPKHRSWSKCACCLYRIGLGTTRIAKHFKVHRWSVHTTLVHCGLEVRKPHRVSFEFESRRKCARCLATIGFGYKAIAKLLRIPLSTSIKFRQESGVPTARRRKHRLDWLLRKPVPPKAKRVRTRLTPAEIRRRAMERYYANHEVNKARSRKSALRRYYTIIKKDPAKLIKVRLQTRIHKVLKGGSSVSIFKVLGCNLSFLKRWLEDQFVPGMSWENYGSAWHIDHIVPCDAFDLSCPVQQVGCFHYSNLRPLWARENHSKHARIIPCQPELPLSLVR
jgi:transposase-like protein